VLTQGAFLDYDLNEESKAVRVYYRRHPVLGVCWEGRLLLAHNERAAEYGNH
jgi:hypothetical protein